MGDHNEATSHGGLAALAQLFPGLTAAAPAPASPSANLDGAVATIISSTSIPAALPAALLSHAAPLGIRCESAHALRLTAPGAGVGVLELRLAGTADALSAFGPLAQRAGSAHGCDVSLQPAAVRDARKRLFVFDMDSTLIRQEVIDEIARDAGIVEQVARITESAMNGEIDFQESLRRRVGLLRGASADIIPRVRQRITLTPGARELCRALKRLGCTMAVLSGGFMPFATFIQAELGLDQAHANNLKMSADGSTLDGETVGRVVDAVRKRELLLEIAASVPASKEEIVAVGDGANDLLMLDAAGLGVAFNAKPRVQEQAQARINQPSLINVLYLLGLTSDEIDRLVAE